jgi:hypothetical protein
MLAPQAARPTKGRHAARGGHAGAGQDREAPGSADSIDEMPEPSIVSIHAPIVPAC